MRCKDDNGIRIDKRLEDSCREQTKKMGDTHESSLSGQLATHSLFETVISKMYGTVPVFDIDK